MRKQPNINLIITVATILVSIGVSWGIVQAKVADIDKLKDKTDDIDRRTIRTEENIEEINNNLTEQKAMTKEVLRILLERKTAN